MNLTVPKLTHLAVPEIRLLYRPAAPRTQMESTGEVGRRLTKLADLREDLRSMGPFVKVFVYSNQPMFT
jgi:hypothetical protein